MARPYYRTLVENLRERSIEATLGILGVHSELREYLNEHFLNESPILADPLFEPVYPWEQTDLPLKSYENSLVHPALIRAMGNPPKEFGNEAFPEERHPYVHQVKAWEILSNKKNKSVVITSGTGSGKTECFMVPILNSLVNDFYSTRNQLVGVQALFIYPLNALINSQKDRLLAWTSDFGSNVRFCLYNGTTPESEKAETQAKTPSQVLSRTELRKSPPPILITNTTMLEYMLVRSSDQPIIQQSQGRLKYIVLDEAHSYIGSQAAELSLLLRRTMEAFGVSPKSIRFIATSATIGKEEKDKEILKDYLSKLGGIEADQVEIVDGKRIIPTLSELNLQAVEPIKPGGFFLKAEDGYNALSNDTTARLIRSELSGIKTLSEITGKLYGNENSKNLSFQKSTLDWLDLCSDPEIMSSEGISFLPLRAHLFHRVLNGLWACVDSQCVCNKGTVLETTWKFGKIYTYARLRCDCGAPIYEVVFCSDCNTPHLLGFQHDRRLIQSPPEDVDEFSLDSDSIEEEDIEGSRTSSNKRIITYLNNDHTNPFRIKEENCEINPENGEGVRINISFEYCCANCTYAGIGQQEAFRHAQLGAPFYVSNVVPTLLEYSSESRNDGLSRPLKGKNLITFTDSRQGTARIAAKIQQDAERSRIRGLVFDIIKSKQPAEGEAQKLEGVIESLKPLADNPTIAVLIQEKIAELNTLRKPQATSWEELIKQLRNVEDINVHILDYYKEINAELFQDSSTLAQILLVREFGRRPKRQNSLETLGLISVQYRGLEKVTVIPPEFSGFNAGLTDWLSFLKICLDYHVRDGIFIEIPDEWLNWLGAKFFRKSLLPPDSDEMPDRSHKIWPQINEHRSTQHRLIRILCHSLQIDPTERRNQDILNSIMKAAWKTLVENRILRREAGAAHYKLALETLAFSTVTEAWICPITTRLLDATFKGFTPYLPTNPSPSGYSAEKVKLPSFEALNLNGGNLSLSAKRSWLNGNQNIQNLKKKGVWTDISDRIIEGGGFFRAAEHSAQQPASRLQRFEKKFKEGRINVLSCSTTMEMGVDIGGVTIVANNNVPPHPANYLQRAGRAGRRQETRSTVFTLCKNNPHEQAIFNQPKWPFITSLPSPYITLSSNRIVQRHINAFVFTYLLNEENLVLDKTKLTCDWFFNSEEGELSICDSFINRIQNITETNIPNSLRLGITAIKNQSVLQNTGIVELLLISKDTLLKIKGDWSTEYLELKKELDKITVKNNANDPFLKKLEREIARLQMEYLLAELTVKGFLPSHGFPTGLAQFDPYTVNDFARQKKAERFREDNLQTLREKPNRNLSIAIREYAPGADVVLNGLVYKSEGLTLNWQIPQGASDVKEIQKIRKAWSCSFCGETGSASSVFSGICTGCLTAINPANIFEFIQPGGFATGFYTNPTNDVSYQSYIPVKEPWINAGGALNPLPNPRLGYYRSNTDGHILYYSAGENGTGYALCLECGHAESMTIDSEIPLNFDSHERLRGRVNGQQNRHCDPNGFSIKGNLHLGYEDKTDVFELYLKNYSTNEFLIRSEANYIIARTLSVVLRQSLADILGINAEELGFVVQEKRIPVSSIPVLSICIFDSTGGGAGFSSSAKFHFEKLFVGAQKYLKCSANCNSACQHCLLQHDTKRLTEFLNRHSALEFLNDEYLRLIALPEEEKILGEESQYCVENFLDTLTQFKNTEGAIIEIYLSPPNEDWDISGSSLRKNILKFREVFQSVVIYLPMGSIELLDQDQKLDLYTIASIPDVELGEYLPRFSLPEGRIIAQVKDKEMVITFATRAQDATVLGTTWGIHSENVLIRSAEFRGEFEIKSIDKKNLVPKNQEAHVQISISDEMNGTIGTFGEKFWRVISERSNFVRSILDKGIKPIEISYYDRYLQNPLTFLLLNSVLKTFVLNTNSSPSVLVASLISAEPRYREYNRMIYSNWHPEEENKRKKVKEKVIEQISSLNRISFFSDRRETSHSRVLKIVFDNNSKVTVRLDQGFGYWEAARRIKYPFDKTVEEQFGWITSEGKKVEIINTQALPTYFFITVEK